jgi:hypothetical protein
MPSYGHICPRLVGRAPSEDLLHFAQWERLRRRDRCCVAEAHCADRPSFWVSSRWNFQFHLS